MSANRRTKFRPRFDNLDGRILLCTATYNLTNGNLYEKTAGESTLLASNVNSFAVTSSDAVVYLEQNGNLLEKPASGSDQVLDRLVSSFQLESGDQINVVDWFDSNLSNAGICNLTRTDFTRDDAITFSDMLGIFNEVLQSGTVTNSEVQDLQTVVANPTTLNIPGYVENLASKVVNPTSTDATYLERYYGTTGATLHEGLVNQWFLGNGATQHDRRRRPDANNTTIADDPMQSLHPGRRDRLHPFRPQRPFIHGCRPGKRGRLLAAGEPRGNGLARSQNHPEHVH